MASQVGRLAGRYAIITLGPDLTTAPLNLTDWQVRTRTEFVDGTAFGDFWDVPVPIKYLWTARARGLFTFGLSYFNAYLIARNGTTDIIPGTFSGFVDNGTAPIFIGQGYVDAASFQAPNGQMAEQELEIRGFGNPLLIG